MIEKGDVIMQTIIPIAKASIFFEGTFTEPRLSHPEGLCFDKEGNLWCGGELGQIYKINADGSKIELVNSTGGFVLGLAFDQNQNLFICDLKHAAVFKLNTKTGELSTFAKGGGGSNIRIPNFPVVDHKRNCLYVSDSFGANEKGPGIWKFDLETGEGKLWYDQQLNFANGMALSPDGNSLYVVETWAHKVSCIDILDNGNHGNIQDFIVLEDQIVPDGIAFDIKGNLYISCYEPSRIYRVTKNKQIELLIDDKGAHTLCHPTNCAFYGEELFTSNLGRWHITRMHIGIQGSPLL
jgi:gluconolactonase